MSQIEFGKLIGKLLNYTGVKNYVLAIELGYDVSYISKVINSKIYPSRKSANIICQKIAAFISREAADSARQAIAKYLDMELNTGISISEQKKQFQNELENRLFSAYLYSTERTAEEKEAAVLNEEIEKEMPRERNSYTLVNPRLQRKYLRIPIDENVTEENPLDLIVLTNLFELSRDDKLHLAGVKQEEIIQMRPELMHFKLILSITDSKKLDAIFDPILLMYMVTNFSSATFSIYATNFPFHSLVMSAKKHFAHFIMPGREGKCLIANTSDDERVILDTYETLDEMIATSCHPIFNEYTVEEMIVSKQYMRSIIGKNIRVVIGTINELFLPQELFAKLAQEHFGDNPEVLEELKNIDIVLNNATYNSDLQILLYEQTLNNYVLTGELSFFNKKVKVSAADREAHVRNMIHILEEHPNIKVKIIKGYFIEEFKQCENPSCYLSGICNYLRITSKYTDKTLLVIRDERMNTIFDKFFAEAWENRSDVVEDNAIISMIELSLNYIELLDMGINLGV